MPAASAQIGAEPNRAFTRSLAREIVKNLVAIGQLTARPFAREKDGKKTEKRLDLGRTPMLADTSVLIDGRILPIVNSGFLTGTLIVPQFIIGEVQHIADSDDPLRRAKGRRGLDVAGKLRSQKANPLFSVRFTDEDPSEIKEIDHKLIALAKRWHGMPDGKHIRLVTVDFNLAHAARAQGVRVLNITDIAQALKLSLVPGEEAAVRIAHVGRERSQGVGYLVDGTMIVVEDAKDKVGLEVSVIITKVHQTPAGQLFFARLQ